MIVHSFRCTDSVLIQCKCGNWLDMQYDPGEPQTREFPGTPGEWVASIASDCADYTGEHTEQNELNNQADFVASQSWDNCYEW